MILAIGGLSIVGGISILTFTKTFGIAFLGNPRKMMGHEPTETPFSMHLPQYIIVAAMMSVAIFPQFYLSWATKVTMSTFPNLAANHAVPIEQMGNNMAVIGQVSLLFIGLLAGLFGVTLVIGAQTRRSGIRNLGLRLRGSGCQSAIHRKIVRSSLWASVQFYTQKKKNI